MEIDTSETNSSSFFVLCYLFFKRLTDIIGSIIGIILLSPLMVIIIILIKLDSSGPILAETPKRVGKNSRLFHMYKFRSMVVGAHDLLHNNPKYKDLLTKYLQNSYKLSINEDPRITSVGRFIRKTSIDE
ncbi:MAG: sugar transferase, partial [Candidatus Daviesbacteria bacterium]|nr:sugar transferase [Candidatus Daviesbacteria bacterium]